MFKELANRDAWSTIRGFVYQVDLTILRWLRLDENTILQLERGEDIDIVNRDISNTEVSRELEQIKYRQGEITLNSDFVLELLQNFHLQRQNNPESKLHFRFVTNTDYTTERPAIFQETGEAGINAWIRLFNDSATDDKNSDLKLIKKHLLKKNQNQIADLLKKKANKEHIDRVENFKLFLESNDGFADFMHSFEWSLKNDDASKLSSTILNTLLAKQYAKDANTASTLYPRLFLHVFKLLTNAGLKQLSLSDLFNAIKMPALSVEDQKVFPNILGLFQDLEGRVTVLEEKMETASASIKTLSDDYAVLAKSDSVFELTLKSISSEPPPIIRNGSLRKEKVEAILKVLSGKSWIAFKGINGTGKSQLATLVTRNFENHFWLELRPYLGDPEKASIIILKFFEYISGDLMVGDRSSWLRKVVVALPNKSLLVLNDLPQIPKDSLLSELIVTIKNSLDNGVKFLTTSNYDIPQFVRDQIDEKTFEDYIDFKFTEKEIIEYLVNAGADSSLTKYVSLIVAITDSSPRLIGAVINELKRINWGKESEDLFDVFFQKNFKTEIFADAQNSIKRFITHDQSRELLYRMSLFHWAFTFEEVQKICSVKVEIPYPNERLSDILNTWIQEHRSKLYQVSPLIYDLGEKNLAPDVIQNTHLAVAKSLIQGKTIDPITASRSIISFIKGKDFVSAGGIILNIYQSVKIPEDIEKIRDWGFLDYWSSTEMPAEMPVVLRSFIRGEQIRLNRLQKKSNPFLLAQLRQYLKEKGIESPAKALIHFSIIASFDGTDLSSYWDHIEAVAELWGELPQGYKDALGAENVLNALWIPTIYFSTPADIRRWLEIIQKFEGLLVLDFFDNDFSEIAVTGICYTIANFKLSGVVNDEILELYDMLIKKFSETNKEVLESLVVRAVIENIFQVQGRIEAAQSLADEKMIIVKTGTSKFILTDLLGKLYWNSKNQELGRKYLSSAVQFQCTEQVNFVETLLYAAVSISETDTVKAQEYCLQAVALSEAKQDYHELDCIQALCECGVACYRNGNYFGSFSSFAKAANRLFLVKEKVFSSDERFYPKTEWIRYYALAGHAVGYFGNMLVHNVIPKTEGGDFFEPFQGMFFFNKNDLSDLYKVTNDPILMSEMALFADGVDNVKEAYAWSLRAFDLARKNGRDDVFLMVSTMCLEYSLVNGKYAEAFESHLLFAALSTHLKGKPVDKFGGLKNSSIAEVIKEKPSEEWNNAEETAIDIAIIPMFMHVLEAKILTSDDAEQKKQTFLNLVRDYIEEASDKELWKDLYAICEGLLNRTLKRQDVIDIGNAHAQKGRRTLQAISLLGLIYLMHKEVKVLNEVLNIYPHFANTFEKFAAIKKYISVPFLKTICKKVYESNFIGDREEYNAYINAINEVDPTQSNSYQLILLPIVEYFKDDVHMEDNRRRWLFEFEKI